MRGGSGGGPGSSFGAGSPWALSPLPGLSPLPAFSAFSGLPSAVLAMVFLLLRHRLARRAQDAHAPAALDLDPQPRALARLRVEEGDVAGVDRVLALRAPALRVVRALAHVLPLHVHALDQRLAVPLVEREQPAGLPPVAAREHDHGVTPLQAGHHTTSLARLMIFMKLRLRSSRATAPKMRVPTGLPSLSMITSAL